MSIFVFLKFERTIAKQFYFRVARLVVDINTGAIFWLLSCNIVLFAAALYQIENVTFNFFLNDSFWDFKVILTDFVLKC